MNVTKANGEIVPFNPGKIRASLKRVNASPANIEEIMGEVENEIFDEISTSHLYRIVFRKLKKLQRGVAGKYNLKRAVMSLGPSGYPFEKYVAALWAVDGFSTRTNLIVKGACVSHEVDVVAQNGGLVEYLECKHHSSRGKVCSVRNALYFYARFQDLERRALSKPGLEVGDYRGWLVTNNRFTSEAQTYGTCVGLGLLSWDFPPKNGLRERIDKMGLHPITCLTSVSKKKLELLMDRGITLCMDLCKRPDVLSEIGITGSTAGKVMREAFEICGTEKTASKN
ncbi:MAG: ATPase [Acidobacteria bacterium]|nr:MAG: ATPase [Acidobacteriota bacterium]REJ98259.1 MAG: ATPase [Acidobacteriota bacterium]REK17003.1 MAG: ATPase [Acidobacteriota bacterium]REK42913.1 MAG: ATPase [Acidobacteriota bacterium]